jgi:maleate isomerase
MKRREFLQAVGMTAAAGAIAEAADAQGSKVIAEEKTAPVPDHGTMDRADDYQALLQKGYGHIGRIGFLSPGIVDETLSAQWYRMAPHGITLVRTSLELKDVTVEEVNAALARTEKASTELGKYKPDCIIFGGSPTVAVPGYGFEKTVVETIEKASGRKAFSAQAAAIEALQKHGARKLALATPFPDNVNALVKEYLEKSGFEILSIRSSGVAYVDLMLTPLQKSWDLGKRVFEEAKSADALYFPGAPQPCVDIIDALEKELGTFVISSLQASLWKALQIIGYGVPIAGYGRLLRNAA